MCDYSKSKIYSIRSHLTTDVYIGSTTDTLPKRLFNHKRYYKQWLITKKLYTTSFKIIEKDFENCYIELVENYPCNNKNELCRREGEIIRATTCVNKNIAGRTNKEWQNDNKEYRKQYRQINKEKLAEKDKIKYNNNKETIAEKHKQYYENNKQIIVEKVKQYRENNKEIIAEKNKKYRENNKEIIVEKSKQYYENNKQIIAEKAKQYKQTNKQQLSEKANQKYTCECGGKYTKANKLQHEKTKKHQSFVNSN